MWIPTSNANVLYRFDPRDKSFAVLPLPREGAFLRMVVVDDSTGALVTSYANIVENVHLGGGNWGVVPMVPNGHVSLDEARAMAKWILERPTTPTH